MSNGTYNINGYKRKLDRDLRHVKVILMSHKKSMSKHNWVRLVLATKKSILAEPLSYFSAVPPAEILKATIDKVFKGFLDDQKIRDAQNRL
jgi:hypothetical protein